MVRMQGLHPYHYQRVQALRPHDFLARMEFSEWIRNHQELAPFILWSDEATFTRYGVFNIHNHHFYSQENPRVVRRQNFQDRFSINVWAAIVNDTLIGPIEIPARLNANEYLNILETHLEDILDNLPLNIRHQLHFQQDGAPVHYGVIVRNWLNQRFPGRWIGRGGPIPWPPRSPDLNPLDYYFWGRIKDIVYATEFDREEELRERIRLAGNQIRQNNFEVSRASHAITRRAQICLREQGNLFENLI